jgi:class 3 adenylate cyclase
MDSKTVAAEKVLGEGVNELGDVGASLEAARSRLLLARCYWEQSRPAEAFDEFEAARRELEAHGPSAELAMAYMRISGFHRWASAEVARHHGFVDKFAGDAVMATFNVSGARLDHTAHALEAALALSGKAALLELGVGIGIAVGPAIVGRAVAGGNVSVLGETTNLAARLQSAAAAGEILLSDEAHRRVAEWLEERGLEAVPEALALRGFDGLQQSWRLVTGARR